MGFSSLKPKRSLGQNFFKNKNLAKHITEIVLKKEPNVLLEIGPGKGFFTQFFVEKNLKILCIEKDKEISEKLKNFLPDLNIFNEDVLNIDFDELLKNEDKPIVCFGSLPYNISKKIISNLIKCKKVNDFFFIVQKEVGQKYTDRRKSSILSLKTKIFVDSKILLNISPENFVPKPNVESCLIHFYRNERVCDFDLKRFFRYLDIVFKQNRKNIKNNLERYFELENIKKDLLKMRAEDLNLDEHIEIFFRLKEK